VVGFSLGMVKWRSGGVVLFASGPVHRPVGVWSALFVTLAVAACDNWSLFLSHHGTIGHLLLSQHATIGHLLLSQHATIGHSVCHCMRSLTALSITACDSDGLKQIKFTVYMVMPLLRFAVAAALCTLIALWLL
jgi:hypothetical protein